MKTGKVKSIIDVNMIVRYIAELSESIALAVIAESRADDTITALEADVTRMKAKLSYPTDIINEYERSIVRARESADQARKAAVNCEIELTESIMDIFGLNLNDLE